MKRELRFGVIGGGPAGLSAAATLRRLGHRNVVVLEKQDEVGGKCKARRMGSETVDAGAVYVLPNYPLIETFARQTEVELVPAFPFIHRDAEGRRRPFGVPPPSFTTWSKVAEYGRLGQALLRHRQALGSALGSIELAHASELSLPYGEWVKALRLEHFHSVAYPLLRSFGFGYEEQSIPALYIFNLLPRFAPGGNYARLWDIARLDLRHLDPGYAELWRRLATKLDVRTGVTVSQVERDGSSVALRTSAGDFELDRLVLAAPLDDALGYLDSSDDERRLFSRIRWLDVWQTCLRLEGLEDAVILDANQAFSRIGHTLIAFRQRPGSSLYYLFGYGAPGLTDAQIEANALLDVQELGARVLEQSSLHRWRYFPHFESSDVAAGCLGDLDRLQGQRQTWYAGEVISNIGVEVVASHAEKLIEKAFGSA